MVKRILIGEGQELFRRVSDGTCLAPSEISDEFHSVRCS